MGGESSKGGEAQAAVSDMCEETREHTTSHRAAGCVPPRVRALVQLRHTGAKSYTHHEEFPLWGLLVSMIVSVSHNAVLKAELSIEGCSACVSDATTRFWEVLDGSRTYSGAHAIYILPVLARCPKCQGQIDEMTLVRPKSKV